MKMSNKTFIKTPKLFQTCVVQLPSLEETMNLLSSKGLCLYACQKKRGNTGQWW